MPVESLDHTADVRLRAWSGLAGGVFAGSLIGLILNYVFLFTNIGELTFSNQLGTAFEMVLVLSFFSMFGDRQIDKEPRGKGGGNHTRF